MSSLRVECAAVHLHSKQAGEREVKVGLKTGSIAPQAEPCLCGLGGGIGPTQGARLLQSGPFVGCCVSASRPDLFTGRLWLLQVISPPTLS